MKKHNVKVVVKHVDGYLTEKRVGSKGRLISRKNAEKIAIRLRKAGYIAKIST